LIWILAQVLLIGSAAARIGAAAEVRTKANEDLERASARLKRAMSIDSSAPIWLGPYVEQISRCAGKWRLTLLSARATRNTQGSTTSMAVSLRSPETAALVGFLEDASRIPGVTAQLERLPYHDKECDVSVNLVLDNRLAVRAR
jgi:hypothetical protein